MKLTLPNRAFSTALLLAFLLTTYLARADEPIGVRFFKGTWKELLAEARRQNKPAFVLVALSGIDSVAHSDSYSVAAVLAKAPFTDESACDYLNTNFIPYILDTSQGEGIQLRKQYNIGRFAVPSLYVLGDGSLVIRSHLLSTTYPEKSVTTVFREEMTRVLTEVKDGRPISGWDQKWADGKRDVPFLRMYLTKRAVLKLPHPEALAAFLNAVPETDWTSDLNLVAVTGNLTTANSKAFDAVLRFAEQLPKERGYYNQIFKLRELMDPIAYNDMMQATTEANMKRSLAILTHVRALTDHWRVDIPSKEEQEKETDDFMVGFYIRTKNADKYRQMTVYKCERLMQIPPDRLLVEDAALYRKFIRRDYGLPSLITNLARYQQYLASLEHVASLRVAIELSEVANNYAAIMTDSADLEIALSWSERAVKLYRGADQFEAYARVLAKQGRKTEAINAQKEAVASAKATGEDTADYEKTLAELRK